ncbi:hypothetical protein N658DRAFT_497407 [Parathielavia hyrcaniae]|uniref:Uncharacterized protein n=1 Tax=Parathielavia hyrcaniae TaxID=113614 RepID=A0AAN6PYQ0_9PEZI|nr:hypothetical protein N658DRAFT_497407 [Parathielavia hyrcaniae]
MAVSQEHLPLAMLAKPSLTFSVPSLHDGLPIDCRVYHPLSLAAASDAPPWKKHAAIIAHPYAPLGGNYDDPVVDIVAGTLLRRGFLVATFNFRGAQGSAGKTSWTAKAERFDYMSVVGFVIHYVNFLDPFSQGSPTGHGSVSPIIDEVVEVDGGLGSTICVSPPTPSLPDPLETTPVLLFGGYSYGAMVTSQLPSVETIAALLDTPECGTHAAEVRLRAQHLAEMQNTVLASARQAAADRLHPQSPRKHVGVRVGGDEGRRKSHESRRSLSMDFEETIRHGVAELMARTRKGHKRSASGRGHASRDSDGVRSSGDVVGTPECLALIPGRVSFRPAYLLVSPLQGIVTNLATMSLLPSLSTFPLKAWVRFPARAKEEPHPPEPLEPAVVVAHADAAEPEDKLVQNPTLAVYGDRDGFVPVKKLRDWASRLETIPGSKFRAHEVSSANHFWAQRNVAATLREAVAAFAASLLSTGTG